MNDKTKIFLTIKRDKKLWKAVIILGLKHDKITNRNQTTVTMFIVTNHQLETLMSKEKYLDCVRFRLF